MDINFLSLSTSPSDHECQDGDLAAVMGVINEDGALQPLQATAAPEATWTKPTGADTNTKYYIHTIDNDDPTQAEVKYYIAKTSTAVYWLNGSTWKNIDTFHANSLQFIGRIICLVGDTETRWAFWRGDTEGYKVFTLDDFKYSLEIHDECINSIATQSSDYIWSADIGTEFSGLFNFSGEPGQQDTYVLSTTKEGTMAIIDAIDAQINKAIDDDDELQKYISFGVAAVRLYDGSHIMLSNIFVIGGAKNLNSVNVNFQVNPSRLQVYGTSYLHKDKVKVVMPKLSDLDALVEGVDIYLTSPSFFRNYKKSFTITAQSTSGKIYPWNGGGTGNFAFSILSDTEYTTEIDNMSFYHSAFISRDEINKGTTKCLKAISETNKSITLADFYRTKYGATTAYAYNSRLDIGDYTSCINNDDYARIKYFFTKYQQSGVTPHVRWNDVSLDEITEVSSTNEYSLYDATAYFRLKCSNSYGEKKELYFKSTMSFPLPPILMLPILNVDSIDVYIHITSPTLSIPYRYRENIPFHSAELGTWSYFFFHNGLGGASFIHSTSVKEGEPLTSTIKFFKSVADGTKFNECVIGYNNNPHTISNRYRNSILVSDSDNPIVFRASNVVTVGNGHVLALAASTQPISLGQAGQTPLYAFTSEGIWPLYVNGNNGAFKATQPGPRDVLTNVNSIAPLDNAVCFASDRGIMVISGNETQCISDNLRLPIVSRTLPHLKNVMQLYDATSTSNDLADYSTGNFQTFLSTCRTVYDYRNQRIVFIEPTHNRHLVFSLRSKAWAMQPGQFYDTINSYPEAKVLVKDGDNLKLCNLYTNTPAAVPFYLITRPLKLGAPDIFKRLQVAIVRGDFYRNSNSKSEVGQALYGSNDLRNWFYITSSNDQYLRRHAGSPYKYYRFALVGTLQPGSSLQGISIEASASINNKLR